MMSSISCSCKPNSCLYSSNATKLESDNVVIHLYQEIENLKKQIAERDYHIVQMETTVMDHAKEYPNGEMQALQETLRFWQEKYDRLLESHHKLQKVNQALEDKLLRIVDKFESEKSILLKDISDLTNKLAEARVNAFDLEEENEQYKNDCNVAINLLQCKPSNFISHKVNSLPEDLQEKIRSHFQTSNVKNRRSLSFGSGLSLNGNSFFTPNDNVNNSAKIIKVPISTFPPTAIIYSVNKTSEESVQSGSQMPDYVSAAIMAKILEERSKERILKSGSRYQKCYQCRKRCELSMYYDQGTQTPKACLTSDDFNYNLNDNHWKEGILIEKNQSWQSINKLDSNTNFSFKPIYSSNFHTKKSKTKSNQTIII